MKVQLVVIVMMVVASSEGALRAEEAPLRFKVLPGSADEPREVVRLQFQNTSEKAVQLYLDRRLATVELRGEKGRRLGVCRMPGDAVPRVADDRRFISLQPGQQAAEALDLRFSCFGKRLSSLEKAKVVLVTYQSRFGVDRLGRSTWTGKLGPIEMTLPEPSDGSSTQAAPAVEASEASDELIAVKLRHVGARPDVALGSTIVTAFEVKGPSKGRLPVAIRPELFHFIVDGPGKSEHQCRLSASRVQPLKEFYERLGRRQLRLDLASFCTKAVFERPGVYEIQPVFSATYDGREVGLAAWTGTVQGRPFLLRIRRAGRQASDPVEIIMPNALTRGGAGDER